MSSDTVTLNDGNKMPLVGFGLWKVPNESCADTVYNAIKTGYRLFDGAADYGNEKEAGQGVARAIKDGLVKREDLFITSKLWNSFHEKDKVLPIAKQQLEDWGLEYFDLYLIHFPIAIEYVPREKKYPSGFRNLDNKVVPINAPLHETWAAMEDVAKQGLAKSIGVSNYQGSLMLDLFRYARTQPAVLQIEHHPYLAQPGLIELCQTNKVAVTAYSSFGPQSFLELKFKRAQDTPLLLENETIVGIGKAHGKTPAQVLLRWATQRGVAVIPKSNNQGRLQQNLDVTQWNLYDAELQQISGLDRNLRFNNPVDYGVPIPIFV